MQNSPNQETARVNHPNRRQITMHVLSLDQLLPQKHLARTLSEYVMSIDTTSLCEGIQVSSSHAGRTATNPEVLLTLWLLATIEGISSARELARLCKRDMAHVDLRRSER